MLVTQRTATIRLIPAIMGIAIRVTVTPIQATAMAVRITALIGATTDALLVELIGDGTAGTETPSLDWLGHRPHEEFAAPAHCWGAGKWPGPRTAE